VGGLNDLVSLVQQIFTGTITNRKQAGGLDLPVRVVSRYSDSGTRRAFDRYVLGGATGRVNEGGHQRGLGVSGLAGYYAMRSNRLTCV
jgi:ABC-type phosphate transport system substrate-binding protein